MTLPPRVVLVTGVSRFYGNRLAAALAADPVIERVFGVDTASPAAGELERVEFVRADIRNPVLARVLVTAEVDTVVHANVLPGPQLPGGRSVMKETNVIGTMQLLAACQKAPAVRKLVVASTTAAYGSSPRDPALLAEDAEPHGAPQTALGRDAVEVEGYVRGFLRRRPDVTLTLLRCAMSVGPDLDDPLARYFALPVLPTVLGTDPRLQLVHTDDVLAVLDQAVHADHPGTYNVAGEGVLLLSQAARRLGRPFVPVPRPAVQFVGDLFRRAGVSGVSPEQIRALVHAPVADTRRLREEFGYVPVYRTETAFADAALARGWGGPLSPELLAGLEDGLLKLLPRARTVHA